MKWKPVNISDLVLLSELFTEWNNEGEKSTFQMLTCMALYNIYSDLICNNEWKKWYDSNLPPDIYMSETWNDN